MTTYNKSTLKTFFENNDIPQGSDYANLIDSQINIVETSLQSMAGTLQAPELVASRVSAGNVNVTGNLTVSGTVSAGTLSSPNNLSIAGIVSAGSLVANTVLTSSITTQSGFLGSPVNIAASGTTLGTANTLTTARLTILTAATDGSATGVALLSNNSGLQQYIFNDTAVSANLWPCTGGQINGLSSGAAFGMTSKTLYTIMHVKASGYAVR